MRLAWLVVIVGCSALPAWAQHGGSQQPPSDDPAYVPLLSDSFVPRSVPESFFTSNSSLREYARQYCATFQSLPTNGPGFRAIGQADVLWGRPELVYGFMEAARRWSQAGGRDLLVYAVSVRDITTHGIDNAELTFGASHVYGSREDEYRSWMRAGDVFHAEGNSIDLREFSSSSLNQALTTALSREMTLRASWIYDMMTLQEIREDDRPIRSPLHIERARRSGEQWPIHGSYYRMLRRTQFENRLR